VPALISRSRLLLGEAGGPAFVAGVSANGRYFVDGNGDPFLVRGIGAWAALVNNTPAELESYWSAYSALGFNSALLSLLPDSNNGSDNDGQTFDGISPFSPTDDVTSPVTAYWDRMKAHVAMARDYGITLFLLPTDNWAMINGTNQIIFDAQPADLVTYAQWLIDPAQFGDFPNIVWMGGGDYEEPVNDEQFDSVLSNMPGPVSMQLAHPDWTTQTAYWTARCHWNFLYWYSATYAGAHLAYADAAIPLIFGEGQYLDEQSPAVGAADFRRATLWALTSGCAGDIPGSSQWEVSNGTWTTDDPDFNQHATYTGWFAGLDGWWDLVPDIAGDFITSGAGTKYTWPGGDTEDEDNLFTNTYATAALKADGSLAVAYLPTQRAITIDTALLGANPVGVWVNPSTLGETAIPDLDTSITPPSARDWLLHITADAS
jgi:hypothetical protein